MSCRVCLCNSMQVYYKLNNNYIDLMETVTEVKMKLNDLVCCFCLATLRKIEKFTKTVKEVDSLLKQSVKTKENGTVTSHYNLVVSINRNISIKCSRALYETYTSNIKRALVKIEEMEAITDEPRHLSEDAAVDNETESANDVPSVTFPVPKEEEYECTGENDELHQLSEDTIVDNETDSKDNVPLITAPDVGSEYETPLNDSCENETTDTNGGYILKDLKICLRRVDIGLLERPPEENSGQQATFSNTNNESFNRKECELNDVVKCGIDSISLSNKPFSCDVCAYRSSSKRVLSGHIRAHTGELHQLSEDTIVDNEIDSTDDVPLITAPDVGSEYEAPLNDSCENETTDTNAIMALKIKQELEEKPIKTKRNRLVKRKSRLLKLTKKLSVNETESMLAAGLFPFKVHHNKKYSCVLCISKTTSLEDMKDHVKKHSKKRIDTAFQNMMLSRSQRFYKFNNGLRCKSCDGDISRFEEIKEHVEKCVWINYKSLQYKSVPYKLEKGQLDCPICKKRFLNFRSLTIHMNEHFPNYICENCGKAFASMVRLRHHIRTHEIGEFPCKYCDAVFDIVTKREQHVRKEHTSGSKHYIVCKRCNISFSSFYARQKHLGEVHNEELKRYKCKTCPQSYITSGQLSSHVRRDHLNERNYKCDKCDFAFYTKYELKMHMVKHDGERKYCCGVCQKSYQRQKTLREHMRIHDNDKRFVCPVCTNAFTQKCSLKTHLKTHERKIDDDSIVHSIPQSYVTPGNLSRQVRRDHSNKRNHKCDKCNLAFYTKNALKLHLIKHGGKGKHCCSVCQKSYQKQKTLREHMRIHDNDKRFVCPVCTRAFTQKCTHKGHLKTHESKIDIDDSILAF